MKRAYQLALCIILNCVLQHADGVISIRFVHAKLGTPIDPNWDHMGLVCSEQCCSTCRTPHVLLEHMPCMQRA